MLRWRLTVFIMSDAIVQKRNFLSSSNFKVNKSRNYAYQSIILVYSKEDF